MTALMGGFLAPAIELLDAHPKVKELKARWFKEGRKEDYEETLAHASQIQV